MLKQFLDFIDSPDIRRYNENYVFTPAEQAVLISMSEKQSVMDKIEVLQYLTDRYTEEEFGAEHVGHCFTNFRLAVLAYINQMQNALNKRFEVGSFFFEVSLTEKGYDNKQTSFFQDYKDAFSYLMEITKDYDIPFYASIIRHPICNETIDSDICYFFNSDLELYDVTLACDRNEPYELNECFVNVPLPFRPGDIVKCSDCIHKDTFGVISYIWSEEYITRHILYGDHSNMFLNLEGYTKDKVHPLGGCFHCEYDMFCLHLSYCSIEELPREKQYLQLIRDVILNELNAFQLLEAYGSRELDNLIDFLHPKQKGENHEQKL